MPAKLCLPELPRCNAAQHEVRQEHLRRRTAARQPLRAAPHDPLGRRLRGAPRQALGLLGPKANRRLPLALWAGNWASCWPLRFPEIAATPGIGYQKICSFIELLGVRRTPTQRTCPDPAGRQENGHACLSQTRHSCPPRRRRFPFTSDLPLPTASTRPRSPRSSGGNGVPVAPSRPGT